MALDAGAAVMVTSHLGRPDRRRVQARGLAGAGRRSAWANCSAARCRCVATGSTASTVAPGEVVLLENCRLNKGEKKNDPTLAQKMAALCDIFVHDAFGTAHRAEASTYGIAAVRAGRLRRAAAGRRDRRDHARRWRNPKRPLVAIVAGSQGLDQADASCRALASKVDRLIVGGGIANTFMLAAGLPIGKSLAEPALVDEAQRRDRRRCSARGADGADPDRRRHREGRSRPTRGDRQGRRRRRRRRPDPRHRPADRGAARRPAAGGRHHRLERPGRRVRVRRLRATAPRRSPARSPASPAFSIAGGGDTLAAIAKYGIENDIGYISTGGGAFLEVLEGKTLPAFEILERAPRLTRRHKLSRAAVAGCERVARRAARRSLNERWTPMSRAPPRSSPPSARRRARPRCSSG